MGPGDIVIGLIVIALGAVFVRFHEPLHRIAPYGHGGTALGVRALGWLFMGFGSLFVVLAVVMMALGK